MKLEQRIGTALAGSIGILAARCCSMNAGIEVVFGTFLSKWNMDLGIVLTISHLMAVTLDGFVAVEFALHTYAMLNGQVEFSRALRRLAFELGGAALILLALGWLFMSKPIPYWAMSAIYVGTLPVLELHLKRSRQVAGIKD